MFLKNHLKGLISFTFEILEDQISIFHEINWFSPFLVSDQFEYFFGTKKLNKEH